MRHSHIWYGASVHVRRIIAVCVFLTFPWAASAQDTLTRREGFLQIWQSIKRPAEPAKTVFSDVPHLPDNGSLEIDFAASRGLIDDTDDTFRPDDPLFLEQALIWMMRSRNVTDDPADTNTDTLADILTRYPIAHLSDDNNAPITQEDLQRLMGLLDVQLIEEEHEVSLYAEKFHGKGTAFGESFDMYALTAAHRSFPPNTLVRVTNVNNGKSVIVRINDRGPYVEGRDMDLSLAAFTSIEDRSKGKFMATFERLGDFRMVDVCNEGMQRRIAGKTILTEGVPKSLEPGKTLTIHSTRSFVIRGVKYPDGFFAKLQDFILPGESFTFTPTMEGEYAFVLGTTDGRTRTMQMKVQTCPYTQL